MKVGFIFSGQGTQHVGMCRDLYQNEPIVKEYFDQASEVLGYDLASVCASNREELSHTSVSQPAIFTASCAEMKLFCERTGMKPDFAAGNSVGEFAALVAADVLSFKDALRLVQERAALMEEEAEKNSGTMYDLRNADLEQTETVIRTEDGAVSISNINGRNNHVISGETAAVERAVSKLTEQGVKAFRLNVSSGFHSSLMHEAADKFGHVLEKFQWKDPKICVIANLTGQPYANAAEVCAALPKQIDHTVRWYDTMKYMEDNGCTEVIEFGSGRTLKNLILRNTNMKAFSYDISEDRDTVDQRYSKEKMAAMYFGRILAAAVSCPNCNEVSDDYETEVVKPYREMESIYISIVDQGKLPTLEELDRCEALLFKILDYKKCSKAAEISRRTVRAVKEKMIG